MQIGEKIMSNLMVKKPKLADPVTRRHLILLLYRVLEEKKPNYGTMHKAVKTLQDMLEAKYGYTLGYEFKDPSIYDIWDNKLQRDIERYDALGLVVDNNDISLAKGYYTHELRLRRPEASFLLKTTVRNNLEKKFGNLEKLTEEIRSIYAKE